MGLWKGGRDISCGWRRVVVWLIVTEIVTGVLHGT